MWPCDRARPTGLQQVESHMAGPEGMGQCAETVAALRQRFCNFDPLSDSMYFMCYS